jgi:hypothetical protein
MQSMTSKTMPPPGGVAIANDEFTIALIPRVISEKSPTMRPPTAAVERKNPV